MNFNDISNKSVGNKRNENNELEDVKLKNISNNIIGYQTLWYLNDVKINSNVSNIIKKKLIIPPYNKDESK